MKLTKKHTPWNKGKKTGIIPTNAWKKGHIPWCAGKSLPKADKSPNWRGGRRIKKNGYIEIRVYDSPNVHKDGYILEHRYVMEKYLGRSLKKGEVIHHINHNRSDNRLENLKIMDGFANHAKEDWKDVIRYWSTKYKLDECVKCHTNSRKHYSKGLCIRCYYRASSPSKPSVD